MRTAWLGLLTLFLTGTLYDSSAAAQIHDAVLSGDVETVRQFIQSGGDADSTNRYGVTPLWIACQTGNANVTRILLAAGADPNLAIAGGETPLMTAARTGTVAVVKDLIDHGAKIDATEHSGQTALMWAAAEGNADTVSALIEAGATIGIRTGQGFTAMLFAAREGRLETVARLVDAGAAVDEAMEPKNTSGRNPRKGMSALMLAVESGHFELALWLVAQGADPNDQRSGYSPLHAVTWVRKTSLGDNVAGDPPPRGSGNVTSLQFVRRMIEAGADVNATLRQGSGGRARLNEKGATVFLLAAKNADLPLLKLLVDCGADPSLTNADDCSALMAAAGIGVVAVGEEPGTQPEVLAAIDWLVDGGLDVNHIDQNEETAMHGAAYRNYPAVVARLAQLGAKPSVWNNKNKYGWTPVMIASGKRPGSFKPSPETIEALNAALQSAADR